MSFRSGFTEGFVSATTAFTFWMLRHPIISIAFIVLQHSVGIYYLGWYWPLLCVASAVFAMTIHKSYHLS